MIRLYPLMLPKTPILLADGKLLIKHEGASSNPCHKVRLAATMLQRALMNRKDIKLVAERSSGSMAIGVAKAANLMGLPSLFICNGPPHPTVRADVKAHGGDFLIVDSNEARIAVLENEKRKPGVWSPDQHDAGESVIAAWRDTLGFELLQDIRSLGLKPSDIGLLLAAVGTGGTLAGAARALRSAGADLIAVGIDISSSIVHGGPRSFIVRNLAVPGVGSNDERCRTYDLASAEIDELVPMDIFAGITHMLKFFQSFPTGCGLSGGLVLACAHHYSNLFCQKGKYSLAILPDRNERYSDEILASLTYFAGRK